MRRVAVILFLIAGLVIGGRIGYSSNASDKKLEEVSGAEKVRLLIDLADENQKANPKQSIDYAKEASALAEELNAKKLKLKSNASLAKSYETLCKYEKAIKHLKSSLKLAEELDRKEQKAKLLLDIGKIYSYLSKYDKALESNLEALDIHKSLEDKKRIGLSYHNIAIVYYYLVNFEKALKYSQMALKSFKEVDYQKGIAEAYNNAAMIYTSLDSIDKAIDYNYKSIEITKKLNDNIGLASTYYNIAQSYLVKGEALTAIDYLDKALKLYKKDLYLRNQALVYTAKARAYYQLEKYENSIKNLNLALDKAEQTKSVDLLANIYNQFSEIYLAQNNYEKAFKYKTAYNSIRDSIFNEESRNKISELEVKIETKQKAKENKLLKETNRLQLILFISVSVLILIIVIVIYSRYKTKKKAGEELEKKNMKITEQNATLENLNKELNEANVAKDKFFSIMAHDLKSPLWWFKNVTELLSHKYEELSKDRIKEIADTLDDSAKTSLHLIENLLQWSRSQTGRIEYVPERFNLRSLIEEIIAHHRLHAESKKIKVKNTVPEGKEIIADKRMLMTVLRNFVSNAIKFTPEGGEAIVGFDETDDNNLIFVKDTGVGIKKDEIDKIFRIDVQHSTLGTKEEKGAGLGLVIAKEFIENQGGTLDIQSEPGKGSKFVCSLPKKGMA